MLVRRGILNIKSREKYERKEIHMKSQKGISLIALIVTIIIILILAGVVISSLTENNELLKMTSKSKEEVEFSSEDDMVRIPTMAAKIEGKGRISKSEIYRKYRFTIY